MVTNAANTTVNVTEGNYIFIVDLTEETASCTGVASTSITIPNPTIPDFVTYNGTQYPVTSVGKEAFKDNTKLLGKLKFGENLKIIMEGAFSGCKYLSGTLDIPDSITEIQNYAFYECTGFTGDLIIPKSITTISGNTFSRCSGFNGKLVMGENVKTICLDAFKNCIGLSGELKIPESVEVIYSGAFYGCTGFTGELKIPESVEFIDSSAFSGCIGFTGDLYIPNSVTILGNSAFSNCSGFDGSLHISESLVEIPSNAFFNCKNLQGKLEIPEGVAIIGSWAFDNCSGFTGELNLPSTIIYIDKYAFYECSGFTGELIIPAGMTTLNYKSFCGCKGISSIVIPANITRIGDVGSSGSSSTGGVFDNCSGLKSITCLGSTPPTTVGNNFSDNTYKNVPLTVPENAVASYRNATEWKKFTTINAKLSLKGIVINAPKKYLQVGNDLKLNATFLPEEIIEYDIEWISSDPSIATVDQFGTVTGITEGKVTITAVTTDGTIISGKIELDVIDFILGDSNQSDNVTVADAVNVANYIMEEEVEKFHFLASDVNFDEKISFADASGIITIVLDTGDENATTRNVKKIVDSTSYCLFITSHSDKKLPVYMDSGNELVAIQGLINSEDIDNIKELSLNSRLASSHVLSTKRISPSKLRFVIFSITNEPLNIYNDILFEITAENEFSTNENIVISNIIASDRNANDIDLVFADLSDNVSTEVEANVALSDAQVKVLGNNIIIEGALNKEIAINTLSGITVVNEVIDAPFKSYILEKGIYVLKIGSRIYKVAVSY